MVRLQEKYRSEVRPALKKELGLENVMAVPRIEKISLNMGLGKIATQEDAKIIDQAVKDLSMIAGQAAAVTTARMSVSNFKLRKGMRVGARVTLRRERMYEFLDRLITVAIPRIRDFRGVPATSFDRQGNYSLGVEEISIFPEIDPDKADLPLGMDITMVIKNSAGPEPSHRLLTMLGMPFREKN